jgi:hypothetical protein
MPSRAELEFNSRACVAQLKLRIVAFSIALVVPIWILVWALQKLQINADVPLRIGAVVFLALYGLGVARIFRRTLRDHQLYCPQCGKSLGAELKHVTAQGCCEHCSATIIP